MSIVKVEPHFTLLSPEIENLYLYGMSKDEIKSQINQVLENFSDKALEELLLFLKQLESVDKKFFSNDGDLKKILSEDKELLEKLAK